MQPVVILGSERSGTNLLRALLGAHSSIGTPPPTGMIITLGPRYFYYFNDPPHLHALVQDALRLTQCHLNPWPVNPPVEQVMEGMNENSFWEIFRVLNEFYAKAHGREVWVSKEPGLCHYIYEMALHLPRIRFLYLVRDGRDVAASMLKGKRHALHVYTAAKQWSEEQRKCLTALADPLVQERIHVVKYEALVEQPEEILPRVMEFLGVKWERAQLEFYKQKDARAHASLSKFWTNVASPIDSSRKGRYRDKLAGRQIQIFESLAWREMAILGYKPQFRERKKISGVAKLVYWLSEAVRRRYARLSASEEDKNRRRYLQVVREIQNREF